MLVKNVDGKLLKVKELAMESGVTDGDHHKQWYLDQILRVLFTKEEYGEFTKEYHDLNSDDECDDDWDVGSPP